MKLKDILSPSIKDYLRPQKSIVEVRTDSDFCETAVSQGWLTTEQMTSAAERYRLGRSRSGKTIFWMIDELGIVRDGHIGSGWVSQMLKAREPALMRYLTVSHCLFGLHLTAADETGLKPVAIVESERTAVVLSELAPESLWLSTACDSIFTVDMLEPLAGRKITVFPHTDPTMSNYVAWLEMADFAKRNCAIDITVQDILEENATDEQKSRCIDILDYILESDQ